MRTMIKTMAVVASLTVALVASPAAAGPGQNKGGGSRANIWIDSAAADTTVLADAAAGDAMHYGGKVSFGHETSYTDDRGRGPWIRLQCEQDGELVYQQSRAGYEGGYLYGEAFDLGPSAAWSGGEADCVGELGHYSRNFSRFMVDATVDFYVAG